MNKMAVKYTIKIPAFNIEIMEGTDSPVTPADPYSTAPDMTDNRNSNGDVVLPYRYRKNNWDIEFDLDISERIQRGLFLLKITPYSTPNGAMPETKLVLQKGVGGKSAINVYDANKKTYLALGAATILDLKFNFTERKLEYTPGDWGDSSYIYLFVEGHCSGVFYIFPVDSGANYIRK
jgi:hypothetical protein